MARVLVTGMSGAGKSTLLASAAARGYPTVDTDDEGWHRPDGGWVESRMDDLLAQHPTIAVSGTADNQGLFYDRFEHVVYLYAPIEVLLARVATRIANPYGTSPEDRAEIVRNVADVEPRIRAGATVELDASRPSSELAVELERLLGPRRCRRPAMGHPEHESVARPGVLFRHPASADQQTGAERQGRTTRAPGAHRLDGREAVPTPGSTPVTASLPRRTVLRGMTASAVAAAAVPWMTAPASAKPQDPTTDWSDFGRKVASAFDALHNVGGAVAVVSADQVLHMATFGVRNLQGRRPVTPSTLFRVGSTTKSMAAALVATYVDDGSIGWHQRSSTPGRVSARRRTR